MSQIKSLGESLSGKLDHGKQRWGFEGRGRTEPASKGRWKKVKHKQNRRSLWDTLGRSNLPSMGIGEEYSVKGIENIFNKVKEENLPSREKEVPARFPEAFWMTKGWSGTRNSAQHIMTNTLEIKTNERYWTLHERRVTHERRPIGIIPYYCGKQ